MMQSIINHGYDLKPVPYKSWVQALNDQFRKQPNAPSNAQQKNMIFPLLKSLSPYIFPFIDSGGFSCRNLVQDLQGSGIFPSCSEEVFKKYLDFFVSINFIPKPHV